MIFLPKILFLDKYFRSIKNITKQKNYCNVLKYSLISSIISLIDCWLSS